MPQIIGVLAKIFVFIIIGILASLAFSMLKEWLVIQKQKKVKIQLGSEEVKIDLSNSESLRKLGERLPVLQERKVIEKPRKERHMENEYPG